MGISFSGDKHDDMSIWVCCGHGYALVHRRAVGHGHGHVQLTSWTELLGMALVAWSQKRQLWVCGQILG
jgi:hypothetical protein